jgi:hypothetical protein
MNLFGDELNGDISFYYKKTNKVFYHHLCSTLHAKTPKWLDL